MPPDRPTSPPSLVLESPDTRKTYDLYESEGGTSMKWLGYGLQGVGGVMAIAGLSVFTVGKLVARAASPPIDEDASDEQSLTTRPLA